jgi:hypothetical protein
VRPFALLEKNDWAQTVFASLGSTDDVRQETISSLERFVCLIYGEKKLTSANEARLEMFLKMNKPKGDKPFSSVKGIDGSSLPPCASVLHQKILRSNYVANVWRSAQFPTHIILPW